MSTKDKLNQDALDYHSMGRKGKIEVIPTKPHRSQRDLALAYSPGVAAPCLAIEKDPKQAYNYTAKGNLVAVISNGTAVLGLGDIGPLASKPVMEGKGLLFKIFADIDVFDIEIDEKDPDKFIQIVKAISPTFGGINLEDIKAPEAFEIETRLKNELNIPLMHDDQHGTAIISAAALINALELAAKKIDQVRIVINGAGAAAIACSNLYIKLGAIRSNMLMCDSKGVINTRREDLNSQKKEFMVDTPFDTLEQAVAGSDVFIGLSSGDVMSVEMLNSMNANPIVFAMANPTPEIDYNLAINAREDIIIATGRSDYPNQVNNVLGFPYIFRGALDTEATTINEEMKLAAVLALAKLAKEPVPESVMLAYDSKIISFGRDYIIPKPFDNRLITKVSMAVAKAAIESGVAGKIITDWDAYEEELLQRMGSGDKLVRGLQAKAKANKKTVVFGNAKEYNILKAAHIVYEEGIANPILLGNVTEIKALMQEIGIDMDVPIIDPRHVDSTPKITQYANAFWEKRKRKGITLMDAERRVKDQDYFGAMMVDQGDADAVISGFGKRYADTLKAFLQSIGIGHNVQKVSGMMILLTEKGPLFFADTAIIKNPTWNDLTRIARMTSNVVHSLGIEPRIAMLSYNNFSGKTEMSQKISIAVEYLHKRFPDMIVDGEIQADYALDEELLVKDFPFSRLAGKKANVFIFPELVSGNLSYKILRGINKDQTIGPILLGMKKPAHIIQMRSSVEEIVNLATVAALDAQTRG